MLAFYYGFSKKSILLYKVWSNLIYSLFARLISHLPAVFFSQIKPATSNQPAVLFSRNKPAPANRTGS
jgi:hypothetical protein